MAVLDKALPIIFRHEGEYSDHPHDSGGTTKYGISLRFLYQTRNLDDEVFQDGDFDRNGIIDERDIHALTKDDAARIYERYFWEPNHYGDIKDQSVATKLLDLAVNMGSRWANTIAQRAVRAASGIQLKQDGICGSKTIHALNSCKPDKLLASIKSEAAGYYRLIVEKRPLYRTFLDGWLNRAYE